jgi:YVTN family beta-propeller protein
MIKQSTFEIQLPTGSLPMGTAISYDGAELYVSTGRCNAVAIIDTQKLNAQGSPLLSARGEGEGEESIVATIPVGKRVWGIALDPGGTKLYTANGASNDVSVVDIKARKELHRIKVGDGPWGIAIVSKK